MSEAIRILQGDALELLRGLEDASIDAIVTDPPAGISFMGREWDEDKGGLDQWIAWLLGIMRECRRVLKPGAHALVWALPRTSHWTATAIEDAGFEIRDVVMHLFGTGFPKSLDVSKAIDKQRTEDREPVRVVCRAIRAAMDARELKSRHIVEHFGGCHARLIDHWAARDTDSQPALPTWDQWQKLRKLLPLDAALDAEVWRLNGRKGQPGDAWQEAEVLGVARGVASGWRYEDGVGLTAKKVDREQKAPASDAARQWQGWGTALKPAAEHWILARKPLVGTVAANVLAHGTGALNIDGCRIGMSDADREFILKTCRPNSAGHEHIGDVMNRPATPTVSVHPAGRWPAHLTLNEDAAALLDEQSGTLTSGKMKAGTPRKNVMGWSGPMPAETKAETIGDTGGASRFFYVAKPDPTERQAFNRHPTVKPIDLMRWLCRLVTPPGGLVLDPFAGSGTTGLACHLEGFRFLGFEKELEYVEIARKRIERRPAAQERLL